MFGPAVGISATLAFLAISSLILIILGVVYFAVSLFIIKAAAGLVGFSGLSSDMAVLSAAILSAASLVASRSK
ncbi:MAG: hypothetical protein J4224_03490 [Candidatus Diapherotrites archaeon]|uniref:Uncharacterized protein n=1 Tax=Candidatus Iainarchaeum sp. TaxID=3101447 RepID=A0A7J4IVZ1_9ARCH|nr:MAG: hypothetical protein QT03_C0001G0191 [archaeon GW2011_AR10]MBS3059458.1 hypothetical protein [Candidatus Diapherotrites archaeon]HIH08519.1 hypothetical protein [Candidatus Diapherotrites archaeon]